MVEKYGSQRHFFGTCLLSLPQLNPISFWYPVENREEPIKSVLSVRPSMRPSETHYLRNRSEDFSETRHEVGGKKCQKSSTAAFLRSWPVLAKAADLCEKKPFLAIFGSFWDFAENPFRGFFLNPLKICQQNSSKR